MVQKNATLDKVFYKDELTNWANKINTKIHNINDAGIEFPYPQRDIHIIPPKE